MSDETAAKCSKCSHSNDAHVPVISYCYVCTANEPCYRDLVADLLAWEWTE